MAEGDAHPMEDTSPSVNMNPVDSTKHSDTFSPEDVEWADSCLEDFPETFDAEWISFKEVLMEIPVLYPESTSPSSPEKQTTDNLRLTTDHSNFPSTKSLVSAMLSDIGGASSSKLEDDRESSSQDEGGSPDIDEIIRRIREEKLQVKPGAENAMLEPADSENVVDLSTSLHEEEEVEPSISEIFRVWDLGIYKDVEEFITQINKELAEVSLASPLSSSVGSWPNSIKEPMDELVSGFSDLNLS